MSHIIYADLESLSKKVERCANNPKKSSTRKIVEHIPCRYSMSTIWAFDNKEQEHTLYCGEDCMKKFCSSLRKHTTNMINLDKKNNTLTKKS